MGRKNRTGLYEIGKKFGKPDLERNGLFSESEYISTGEKYQQGSNKEAFLPHKGQGRQFQTSPGKKGQFSREVYFDKEFGRILEKEAVTDLISIRRKARLAEKERDISKNPFRPSNVPPNPSGKGSTYGTIEQQWPLLQTEIDISKFPEKVVSKSNEHRPNFLTRPPKKGSGYGYANLTIGSSFEYKSDPYGLPQEQELKEKQLSKKKVVGTRPFIAAGSHMQFFNQFTSLSQAAQGKKGQASLKLPTSKFEKLVAFKPPSLLTGECINAYPKYEAPPERAKKNEVLAMLEEDEKKKKYVGPVFRPTGSLKSYPVRSMIDANCPKAMPAWLASTN